MTKILGNRSLVFGVEAPEAVTFASVAVIILFVALAGCIVPLWHATSVDPAHALRSG
jgi:ABC-type antimicrobial peptide transport system permease subunit